MELIYWKEKELPDLQWIKEAVNDYAGRKLMHEVKNQPGKNVIIIGAKDQKQADSFASNYFEEEK